MSLCLCSILHSNSLSVGFDYVVTMAQFLIPDIQGCFPSASHVQSSNQIDLSLSKGKEMLNVKATLLDHLLTDRYFSEDTNNTNKEASAPSFNHTLKACENPSSQNQAKKWKGRGNSPAEELIQPDVISPLKAESPPSQHTHLIR